MNRLPAAPTCAALLLLAACAGGSNVPMPEGSPIDVKATGTPGQASATRTRTERLEVMAVDPVKRTISLKQPTGEVETMSVGKQVERLEDIKPGDVLLAEYDEALMLQYQPPNTGAVPETAFAVARREDSAAIPGVGGATGTRETVMVVSIDYVSRLVIFELQNGERKWVKAAKGIQLQNLKVGDRLLVTYTQSMVVKLQKP